MKMFHLPINDKRIQSLTQEQIDFMLYADIADDPEKLRRLENYYYDPDFDDEFDNLDKDEGSNTLENMSGLGFSFEVSQNISTTNSKYEPQQEIDDFFREDDEFLEV